MFVFMFYQTKFIRPCLLKSLQSAAIMQTCYFTSHPLCKPLGTYLKRGWISIYRLLTLLVGGLKPIQSGGLLVPPFLNQDFPIEKTYFLVYFFFDFPKDHTKLGKVKKFGVNQIKNCTVGALVQLIHSLRSEQACL